MKRIAIFAMMLLLGTGVSFAQEANRHGDLVIEKPWARASIGTDRPAAAFMTIRNMGSAQDTLLAVSSSLSRMAEVHATSMNNGVMRMAPAGEVTIPAEGEALLAPGGLHIMMMKLTAPLKKGETVQVTLTFKRAGEITVTAPIYGFGATGPQ